jgi:uncharacterized protein YegL
LSVFNEFTISTGRPLPVIVLADTSGSMSVDGKIDALNRSVNDMARDFAAEDDRRGEIQVAVIAFGGTEATLVNDLVPARDFVWTPLEAGGSTPLGSAIDLAREILEDREKIPSRAYRPTLVLVSDGQPRGVWREQLHALLTSERASKAFRLAVAIGADADRDVLQEFLANPGAQVFDAHEAGDIVEFFQLVTMSVSRAMSSGKYQTLDALDLQVADDLDTLGT